MLEAGKLDRRVQFRRAGVMDDGLSEGEVWRDHGLLVWASRADVSDGEKVRAAQVQASIGTRFVVRWSPFTAALTPKDRLVCEGVSFDITGIKETGGARQFLELTTMARQDG